MKRVSLSNNSSDKYKNFQIFDKTELDTEPDTDKNDNVNDTTSIT